MEEINFASIEKKWQDRWEEKKIFEAKENKKGKYYVLEMFPYPSGTGIHMGHSFNYVLGDILARYKILNGFNVLHPMGFDSLGLPAENAAIKAGTHPEDYTNNSIPNFILQQKTLGLTYDWSRVLSTADPAFYKWDQWIFLKMLEKNLAYQKTSAVNWCPKCETVLANEQVVDGKCWRHEDTDVEIKHLKQWFFRITDYADELYEDIKKLDWPDKTKAMQRNWIGKSHGTEIDFEISKFGDIKDKEFVFLHAYGDNSKSVFWEWLKKEIELRGGNVIFTPNLPGGKAPKLEEQLKAVLDNYSFNENTIVIGHSLGNILMMKILENISTKISGFIMVGSPLPRSIEEYDNGNAFRDFKPRPTLGKYCNWKFDYNKIKMNVKKIVVLEDENDHIVPGNDPKKLAEFLNAEYILSVGNKSHYNGKTEESVLNCIFEKWPIFTTRPDTIFGVTFMVVSAQHPKLDGLVTDEQKKEVDKFLKKLKSVSEKEVGDLEKEGVFSGSYAINPMNSEKIPVWIGNFVVADYGSGMVMAVPAHDQRDFDFAKKYKIDIKKVIKGELTDTRAFSEKGKLINSGDFNELEFEEAKKKITDWLTKKKLGRKVVNFRLRDWGISRQRYWGTPIPIIHCEACGAVPVPENGLPVILPKDVKFGEGNPLETNESWIKTPCPKCGKMGRRETDTMDTFVNSSWYFLRFCDPNNSKKIFSKEKVKYWNPVDTYIGGAEHACMHLIYSRFYTKFLADLNLINFREPFPRLYHQGMINGNDGEKMSKSKGNGVEPLEIMKKYGVDTTRFFLVSVAAPDKGFNWSDSGIQGSSRFTKKVINYLENNSFEEDSKEVLSELNKTIKNVSEYYENFEYRKATIELRELFDLIEKKESSKETFEKFLLLLNPICPHLTEELWEKMGNKNFISNSNWPKADASKISKKDKVSDLNSKIVKDIEYVLEKVKGDIKNVYLYVMPFEVEKVDTKKTSKAVGKNVKVFAVNDSKKYDPESKAKKAKPGKVAIYLE